MPPQQRWFKSEPFPLSFTDEQIDVEAGILRDVVMCQCGPAKGHGVHLEQEFIDGLGSYASQNYSEGTGLKARFGHPSMSDTTMGAQMGHFKNIRVDGEQLKGDLHLLNSAELSPKAPKMRSWMLAMAKESTDFVMSSIVHKPSGHYQYDPDTGDRVELETTSWGRPRPKFDNERVYVAFDPEKGAKLLYTDLVESGAATNSLFGAEVNPEKFAVRAIEFVQQNPDMHEFLKANPDKLSEFAEQLDIRLSTGKKNLFAAMREFFQAPSLPNAEKVEGIPQETDFGDITALQAEVDALKIKNDALTTELEAQKELHAKEAAEWADSTRELEAKIQELEEKHLAAATEYETNSFAAGEGGDSVLLCATTRKAMK